MNITKLMPLSAVDCMRNCSDARGVRCEGSTTQPKGQRTMSLPLTEVRLAVGGLGGAANVMSHTRTVC